MLRSIREIRPRWIVGENVAGLINWSGGLVFEEVQADLEHEGYQVLAFILPAVGINAPHKRDRIWFIGYSEYNGLHATKERGDEQKPSIETRSNQIGKFTGANCIQSGEVIKDTNFNGLLLRELIEEGSDLRELRNTSAGGSDGVYISEGDASHSNGLGLRGEGDGIRESKLFSQDGPGDYWKNFPIESPICSRDDEFSCRLDAAALLDGRKSRGQYQAYNHWRQESIRGFGSAVVPLLVLQIYKAIQEYENRN